MELRALFSRKRMCLISLGFLPGIALAASDGTLGPTSTGSVNISITVPEQIKISKLADANLTDWTGSGNKSKNEKVCVYTNKPSGTYQVTLTGDGPGGSFVLTSPEPQELPYTVEWNDEPANNANAVLASPGVTITGQTGADTTSNTCSGGNTSNARVRIVSSEFNKVHAGTYTGNLSILVEPN